MDCERMEQLISEYLDKRLTGNALREVEAHLASCKACSEDVKTLKEVRGIVKAQENIMYPREAEKVFFKKLESLPAYGKKDNALKLLCDDIMSFISRQRLVMRPVLAFATAALLCLVFLGVPRPELVSTSGMVKIYLAKNNQWSVVEGKVRVGKGDIIKTFGDGQTDIEVKGVCSMRLKPDSEIRIAKLGSKISKADIKYDLIKGKLLIFHGQKAMRNNPFKIETPESVATAIGTDFMVNVFPMSNKTMVGVLDGQVLVNSLAEPDKAVMVNGGQKTEIYARMKPLSPEALGDDEWSQMQELYQLGQKPQVALLISSSDSRVLELLRPCPLYITDSKDSDIPALLKDIVEVFNKAISAKSQEKHLEVISKLLDMLGTFPDKKYNPQILLFVGAYYNYLGEYQDAIDTFKRISIEYPKSYLLSLAECAQAYIYEINLAKKEDAKKLYNKIVNDFPASPESRFAKERLKSL